MTASTLFHRSGRARRAAPRRVRARRGGQAGRGGKWLAWLARAGLAARGLMYVLIGIIAIQVAVNGSHQQADRTGAVHLVAQTGFGSHHGLYQKIGNVDGSKSHRKKSRTRYRR